MHQILIWDTHRTYPPSYRCFFHILWGKGILGLSLDVVITQLGNYVKLASKPSAVSRVSVSKHTFLDKQITWFVWWQCQVAVHRFLCFGQLLRLLIYISKNYWMNLKTDIPNSQRLNPNDYVTKCKPLDWRLEFGIISITILSFFSQK